MNQRRVGCWDSGRIDRGQRFDLSSFLLFSHYLLHSRTRETSDKAKQKRRKWAVKGCWSFFFFNEKIRKDFFVLTHYTFWVPRTCISIKKCKRMCSSLKKCAVCICGLVNAALDTRSGPPHSCQPLVVRAPGSHPLAPIFSP